MDNIMDEISNNTDYFNPNLSFNATPLEDIKATEKAIEKQLYTVMPTDLLADATIAPLTKCVYAAINSLSWKIGLCRASNKTFNQIYPWLSTHVMTIQGNKLIEARWVYRQLFNRPGSCRRYLVTKCYYPRYQQFLLNQGHYEVAAQLEAFFSDIQLSHALMMFKDRQDKVLEKRNKGK